MISYESGGTYSSSFGWDELNPLEKTIYHISHVKNLPSILRDGGLRCKAALDQCDSRYQSIADWDIETKRGQVVVDRDPGGTLHDYVPFYFNPRSPMLMKLKMTSVSGYRDGIYPIIVFAAPTVSVESNSLKYLFTDGHAIESATKFYSDLRHLNLLDWEAIERKYWNSSKYFPDRKRKRQAEFLVHMRFPFSCITNIGVATKEIKEQVEQMLSEYSYDPIVEVRREWYFEDSAE